MPRSLSLWNFSLVLWHFAPFPSQFHIHESHYINSITACYSSYSSLFIFLFTPGTFPADTPFRVRLMDRL